MCKVSSVKLCIVILCLLHRKESVFASRDTTWLSGELVLDTNNNLNEDISLRYSFLRDRHADTYSDQFRPNLFIYLALLYLMLCSVVTKVRKYVFSPSVCAWHHCSIACAAIVRFPLYGSSSSSSCTVIS